MGRWQGPDVRLAHTAVIDGGWAPYMCRAVVISEGSTVTSLTIWKMGGMAV
ncbi:hypothetical protein [Streptomyces sp. NBC_00063]|uniref:hypothetical protein n=1 Tax=Streptomyces sp. NBC_00063 TaxID=2975638 RepID=UPI003EBDB98E